MRVISTTPSERCLLNPSSTITFTTILPILIKLSFSHSESREASQQPRVVEVTLGSKNTIACCFQFFSFDVLLFTVSFSTSLIAVPKIERSSHSYIISGCSVQLSNALATDLTCLQINPSVSWCASTRLIPSSQTMLDPRWHPPQPPSPKRSQFEPSFRSVRPSSVKFSSEASVSGVDTGRPKNHASKSLVTSMGKPEKPPLVRTWSRQSTISLPCLM